MSLDDLKGPAPGRRLTVLASGGGRSLDNLALRCGAGELNAELAALVCDRRRAGVLDVAARHGIAAHTVRPRDFEDHTAFARAVFGRAEDHGTRLVVLAGFLRHLPIPPAWLGHVVNIHPSLLPAYGGQGFYGDRVHAAVLAAGETRSGCTVHYVDDEYDHGPPILTRTVEVLAGDDVHTLAARVFEQECAALPAAIALHLDGEIDFERARVRRVRRP
ncbi:Phosphoribosylglycinamide formyltransferase [Planctomycetes bacterium Pla163]|uniref:phosphoribosylglycinamide formyltransferase 1 n=1 Tax=Rohdeia mirabilis TaxID=2528008 RepID=A0A518CZY1_9BACT|nr:Phosphoribosylglycinamide formyltransferase [Planctomycetes bacterium Pla163]